MTDDIVTRLRKQHTIQYGWKLGELVKHTEHNSDPQIRDRMNRCEVCEQWSPCDGIKAADEIERLRNEVVSIHTATHQAMWLDTIIPIAEACGVGVSDEDGNPRHQFQMVEEIIKAVRGE